MAESRLGRFFSPRAVGWLVLATPVVIGVAVNLFPNYDARPEYFRGTYANIVDAGAKYAASLGVMGVAVVLLVLLALALTRVPGGPAEGVSAALVVPAVGMTLTALTAIPVVVQAARVRSAASSIDAAAKASQSWATLSQTILLLGGIGGALAAFIALGVTAFRRRWIRPLMFWTAAALSAVLGVGGLSLGLLWMGLGLPALVLTLTIAGALIALPRWPLDLPR